MRLVIIGLAPNVWAHLEPETPEEMSSLEACAARGEWAHGRREEAMTELGALADRLGHPVGVLERRIPPRLIVVRRGEQPQYARLTTMAGQDGTVIWDRRQWERRTTARSALIEQRRRNRRCRAPDTWGSLGFLMVHEPPPPR